ncbi:MAG: DegT/DnrJ/EryC1/StrS family aminotransferase [bacterium]
MKNRPFLSPPHMSDEGFELDFVKEAFDSNWIAPLGPMVDAFEREFAQWIGVDYAAALSSGIAALHLALILLGVQPGDEVICSTFTFAAPANAITYVGAKPVFIDSDLRTWNMDPHLLEEFIQDRIRKGKIPKAAIIVDILGQSADWEPIQSLCAEWDIPIIEDAAEALGAQYKGNYTGTFGELGTFSFNGNKIITTSGGGMLISRNKQFIQKARYLATQARDPLPYYQHSTIGHNYRLSNILAAIGRGQLKVLNRRIAQRRKIFQQYKEYLNDLPGLTWMPEPDGFNSTHWLSCVLIEPELFGATREEVRLALEEHNIESRPLWKPMHLQPVFKDCEVVGGSVSEMLFEKGLSLPSGTAMTESQMEQICDIVRSVHKTPIRT